MTQQLNHAAVALSVLLACSLAAVSDASAQQIYRTVDENGKVVFTDQPGGKRDKTEPVTVEPPNTFDPATAAGGARWNVDGGPSSQAPNAVSYRSLTITAPANEESVRNNVGAVTVILALQPALQYGHQIRVLIDGKQEQKGPQSTFVFNELERGEHSVRGQIVDPNGKVLLASASSTFYLQRFSKLTSPRRPTPAPNSRAN
jgi:hypothetical protein